MCWGHCRPVLHSSPAIGLPSECGLLVSVHRHLPSCRWTLSTSTPLEHHQKTMPIKQCTLFAILVELSPPEEKKKKNSIRRCSVGLLSIEHVFVSSATTHREETCALNYHTDPTPDWQITTILGTDLVLKFSSAQATTGLGAAVS